MNIGLQTFTIRKAQKRNMESAYLPFIEMGITDLELARIDFTRKNAERFKHLSQKYGIRAISIQVKPKYVFGDVDGVVDFCNTVGCKNVVISMLPFECILGSEESFYSFIARLDDFYEIYKKQGITLAYHHHNWEYIRLSNGKTRMEELLEKTEKIRFVHDTYWTAGCGVDPAVQIRRFGNRLLGIHLRDLSHRKKLLDVVACNVAVGEGVIDFEQVLIAAREVGCEYTVIEQKTDKPYDDVKLSYGNLMKIKSRIEE